MKRRDFLAASTSAAVCTSMTSAPRLKAQTQTGRVVRERPSWTSENIFLQGINAPVFQEVDLGELQVTGEIPPELNGIYIRNGPNPMFQPSTYAYPLEGDGMLHAVYFEEGKARYRNRWILTQGLLYEMQANRALPELRFHNYANTNIISHAGKLLALYETGLPYEISPDLETVGEWNFYDGVNQSMTAHPKFDPRTGELHFYRYSFFTEPYLVYYVANAAGKIIRTTPIDLPQPALIHDMAMSENYAIFCHCPLVFEMQQAMQTGMPFVWKPEQGARIGLIDRHNSENKPVWIEIEAFWIWHFMNAFEQDGKISVDCAYYPEMKLESTIEGMTRNQSHFRRIVIDPNTKSISQQPLDDRSVDFPTVAQSQISQPYQFGYMPHIDLSVIAEKGIPNYFPELIQYDVLKQTSQVHRFRSGCYGGEAVIVPAGAPSAPDHYVMTWVFDQTKQTSDLLILNGSDFSAAPVAQIHLPVRVPMGLHGSWVET
ncbi:MAG: carotenoid oxygenase family protein [Cyanobacteria bacterium RM1_2_2]|nr:carotenoid oxygenase family protein [Cyanobacteria bacterium RM1_2_2]